MLSRVRQFERSRRLPLMVVLLSLAAHLGCSLFAPSTPNSSKSSISTRHPILPPIQASPDAIQLDVFFIERPAEDHLLTTGIWKDIDQIGAMPSETREILTDNGFRIGHVGSNPPLSVQKLLGMFAEFPNDSPEYSKPLLGRHQFLSPGLDTEIPTGIEQDQCDFLIRDGNRSRKLEYEQVSCVLRMKAHRLQEGWVRVDFQPEIHHGDKRLRHTPLEEGWTTRAGQNIDVRHSQKFSVTMNLGELALITATSNDEGTLGDRFFCHEDRGYKKQRVLIVRIVDSGQVDSKN